jgi:hypothetical protein
MFKGLSCFSGLNLEGDAFLFGLSIRGNFGTVILFLSGLSFGGDFSAFSDGMFKGLSGSSGFSLEGDVFLFASASGATSAPSSPSSPASAAEALHKVLNVPSSWEKAVLVRRLGACPTSVLPSRPLPARTGS